MKKLNLITKDAGKSDDIIDIQEEDIAMSFLDNINKEDLTKATNSGMTIRGNYEFKGKAIWLPDRFDYILGLDSNNAQILVILKKRY